MWKLWKILTIEQQMKLCEQSRFNNTPSLSRTTSSFAAKWQKQKQIESPKKTLKMNRLDHKKSKERTECCETSRDGKGKRGKINLPYRVLNCNQSYFSLFRFQNSWKARKTKSSKAKLEDRNWEFTAQHKHWKKKRFDNFVQLQASFRTDLVLMELVDLSSKGREDFLLLWRALSNFFLAEMAWVDFLSNSSSLSCSMFLVQLSSFWSDGSLVSMGEWDTATRRWHRRC